MTNEQIKEALRVQLLARKERKIKIAHTVYPTNRLPFNAWTQYIRRATA